MVLISERQQLLFFHVPKCAGESVCKFVQAHVPDAKRYNGILTRGPDRGRDLMHVTPLTALRFAIRREELLLCECSFL